MITIKRALISVSDKRGLVDLAKALADRGIEMISTGGTAKALTDAGASVMEVSRVTGFPEMMDGRVKTLHPHIHGGILARRDREDHLEQLLAKGIVPIDLVVVNLYPFEATIAKPGCSVEEAIENIDIGGPCLIRASAKNHAGVVVVTDPNDYPELLQELDKNDGRVSEEVSLRFANKAFRLTSHYDRAITEYFDKL